MRTQLLIEAAQASRARSSSGEGCPTSPARTWEAWNADRELHHRRRRTAVHARDLFVEYSLRPRGHPPLRPARLQEDALIAKAVANSTRGAEDRQRQRAGFFLNIKGPGCSTSTWRRSRSARSSSVPVKADEACRHRLLRRDGVALPRGYRHQLRHGVDHRAPAAGRDRRRSNPCATSSSSVQRQPGGPDRPGHPAARPARREDQDRAAQRRGRRPDLQPLSHPGPAARRRRGQAPGRRRPVQGGPGHDRADRDRDVPRGRRQPVPGGHLPERRQGDPLLPATSRRAP